jgi:putative tryptophan/tyrosine transport system substrate-binding protein
LAAAEDLVRSAVEVIVVASTPAALAAKQATRTVPIVMTVPADPIAVGLVASLARPGGNVSLLLRADQVIESPLRTKANPALR